MRPIEGSTAKIDDVTRLSFALFREAATLNPVHDGAERANVESWAFAASSLMHRMKAAEEARWADVGMQASRLYADAARRLKGD